MGDDGDVPRGDQETEGPEGNPADLRAEVETLVQQSGLLRDNAALLMSALASLFRRAGR